MKYTLFFIFFPVFVRCMEKIIDFKYLPLLPPEIMEKIRDLTPHAYTKILTKNQTRELFPFRIQRKFVSHDTISYVSPEIS